jgi:hypothetical protein
MSRTILEAGEMSRNVVNLDALIPRADMADVIDPAGSPQDKIDIHHLEQSFFSTALRKPDFQRETAHWSPEKVVDLIRAFVDGDLIPAVILWQRGRHVFVIDGAHRLGALLAWVKDDYGDRQASAEYFGGQIPEEQRRAADRTRALVNTKIGPYAEYLAARAKPEAANPKIQPRVGRLASITLTAQWVPAVDQKAAEDSFFKINQAATPIEPTERRILKSRLSPNAVAARAIIRGGTGHKYWSHYVPDVQKQIEALAKEIYKALYEPPIGEGPIKTLDLPVAGRGYNELPLVFDFVNWANGVPDPTTQKELDKTLPADADGTKTTEFLGRVRKITQLLTGVHPSALGLHPAVYFYSRGGEFQPAAFLASAGFVSKLVTDGNVRKFSSVRKSFEDFLLAHKDFVNLTVKRTGAGRRSMNRIARYYELVFEQLILGKAHDEVLATLHADQEFLYLAQAPQPKAGPNPSGAFSRATRSASFLDTAISAAVQCGICGAIVHRNSMHVDHITPKSDGGKTDVTNAQIAHPYCDSSKGVT